MIEKMTEVRLGRAIERELERATDWWKRRRVEIYGVIPGEDERIIEVREVPDEFGVPSIATEDILTDKSNFNSLEKITFREKILKKIEIFRRIDRIRELTQIDGGVLSHKGSVVLSSLGTSSLLAPYELDKLYPKVVEEIL